MLRPADNLGLALDSIRAHKLRAALTVLGLTMGVATLITVMTLVQGANLYVEQKIANLGTNVFRVGRLPFAVIDFTAVAKAQRNRISLPRRYARRWPTAAPQCQVVGRFASSTSHAALQATTARRHHHYGYTPNMVDIDTRTLELGRYFTDVEDRHAADVCLIGDRVAQEFFPTPIPSATSSAPATANSP